MSPLPDFGARRKPIGSRQSGPEGDRSIEPIRLLRCPTMPTTGVQLKLDGYLPLRRAAAPRPRNDHDFAIRCRPSSRVLVRGPGKDARRHLIQRIPPLQRRAQLIHAGTNACGSTLGGLRGSSPVYSAAFLQTAAARSTADVGTLHDAFVDELRDVNDAEKQLTKALPKLVKTSTSDTVSDLRSA